ncbi:MAG: SLC13 family permease [Alphaproteobacteria bacterium]
MDAHSLLVAIVFVAVYAGMALGRWPALAIDRTGVALIGAIVLLIAAVPGSDPLASVNVGALAVLFGLMVLSAQFAASGFYGFCAARLGASDAAPWRLLALVVCVTGALSTVLANDIVVFAMTPILCRGLLASGRDPRPYLLAHAGAANAGSAATLIGNPQNILIGEHGGLDFWRYALDAAPVALAALAVVFVTVAVLWRRELATPFRSAAQTVPVLNRPALAKGLVATAVLLALLATDLPAWQSALMIAGALLVSRRLSTRDMLALVDWHLLVLFAGLFIVTGAFSATTMDDAILRALESAGIRLEDPEALAALSLLGSNTVGNVPFVTLVLAAQPGLSPAALHALAVLSTLAGNLLLVGSLANLIVAERAKREGVILGLRDHFRAGGPMTLFGMLLALGWLLV